MVLHEVSPELDGDQAKMTAHDAMFNRLPQGMSATDPELR
jgi:hypothetical protein